MQAAEVRSALHYDPETGVMVWIGVSKYHCGLLGTEAGGPQPSQRGKLYHKISIGGRKHSRSRLAFVWMTGAWPDEMIDHINGNSLDDRWANLRPATATQNAWNHQGRAKKSSLPMGVRSNASGRYSARLAVNKRMIHLGAFDTQGEASAAYLKARETHYGEFA